MSAAAATKPKAPLSEEPRFDGSNWEDLSRLCTLSKLHRFSATEVDNEKTQSAWVARHFTGPALDFLTQQMTVKTNLFDDFTKFTDIVREEFGITEELLVHHWRAQLEGLAWRTDLPTFFAEFDRLTQQCGMGANDTTKIVLLTAKMPTNLRRSLANQAFAPTRYTDWKSGLLTRWTLDPQGTSSKIDKGGKSKPKCGKCNKKGHTASECRSPAQASGN